MKKSVKFLLVPLAAIAIVAVVITGRSRARDQVPKLRPLPPVVVVHPKRGEAIRSITLPGDLVGYYESTLYSKVTGYLQHIYVDKGDKVRKGQLLAVIEVPELAENLQRARANRDIQRITYQRLEKVWLTDPRLVARQDVDVARAKFQEAQAAVAELKALESYTRIIAPFDGIITARFVDPGALVKAGGGSRMANGPSFSITPQEGSVHPSGPATPVVSEAMIKTLRAYIYVPQDDVTMVRRGTPAIITLHDFPHRKFLGKVTRFSHSLGLATRTMLTEVDIPNPTGELYPGMYADVMLQLERHHNAIMLPDQAVDATAHRAFVFLVKNGRLTKRTVVTGINNGRDVEIVSGLSTSDLVVGSYSPSLIVGQRVHPVLSSELAMATSQALAAR